MDFSCAIHEKQTELTADGIIKDRILVAVSKNREVCPSSKVGAHRCFHIQELTLYGRTRNFL